MERLYKPETYPWRTQYNAVNTPKDHEVNILPSKTIPDQSMPVIEIMKRYSQGLPLGGAKNPVYYGEEPGIPEDWEKWDLSERMAYKEENLERIKELQKKMQEEYEEARKPKDVSGPVPPQANAPA